MDVLEYENHRLSLGTGLQQGEAGRRARRPKAGNATPSSPPAVTGLSARPPPP
jgi:hypothetical protein